MSDLPAMDPCPVEKRGRHHLVLVIPGEDTGDLTALCEMCGAMRRVPANGALLPERMDDALVFAEAESIFGFWEKR